MGRPGESVETPVPGSLPISTPVDLAPNPASGRSRRDNRPDLTVAVLSIEAGEDLHDADHRLP